MNLKFSRIAILSLTILCFAAAGDKVRNVLIIGDSISIGYTPFIRKALSPGVNIVHNPGNGGSTLRGVDSVETWVGDRHWDVILFNFGLHDLVYKNSSKEYDLNGKVTVSLEEYRSNLNQIIVKLRKTKATLIFVNTTMVPENAAGRKTADPEIYNAAALEVMQKNGIQVVDLYSLFLTVHPLNSKPGNVHYTEKGYELLAEPLVNTITALLEK